MGIKKSPAQKRGVRAPQVVMKEGGISLANPWRPETPLRLLPPILLYYHNFYIGTYFGSRTRAPNS